MSIQVDTITLPSCWASFLINGDESFFEECPEDREAIAQVCIELGINPCEFLSCSDEEFYSRPHDAGEYGFLPAMCMCLEYTYPVPEEPHCVAAGATWQIEVSRHHGWEKNQTKITTTIAFDSFDPLMSEESCDRAAKMWIRHYQALADREQRSYHVAIVACPIGYPKEIARLDAVR